MSEFTLWADAALDVAHDYRYAALERAEWALAAALLALVGAWVLDRRRR